MIIYSRGEDPSEEPITLEEAKRWLKVDGNDEDEDISDLIIAARIACEAYAGLSFITRTRTVKLDRFCGDVILPYGPVTTVDSFTYLDGDGVEQLIAPEDYSLDIQSGLARLRVIDSWPVTNRSLNNIVVEYTAGYEDANAVPRVIKQAMKMVIASLYENRQDEVAGTVGHNMNWNSFALLDTIKVYWSAEV